MREFAAKHAGEAHIVVAHHADGPKVTDHASKKAAMARGKELRAQGVTAVVHSAENARKFGLDPRNQPRDENGKFT